MSLAHGSGGGSAAEALILALPLVVIGVVLFVQKTAKPIVSVVLIAAGIGIAVSAMTVFAEDDHAADASTAGDRDTHVSTVTGLCEARRLAANDPDAAGRVFENEVHVPLHDLAAEVQEQDRAAASDLLEAKEAVESELQDEDLDGDRLDAGLGELLAATVAGLAQIDVEAPTC